MDSAFDPTTRSPSLPRKALHVLWLVASVPVMAVLIAWQLLDPVDPRYHEDQDGLL